MRLVPGGNGGLQLPRSLPHPGVLGLGLWSLSSTYNQVRPASDSHVYMPVECSRMSKEFVLRSEPSFANPSFESLVPSVTQGHRRSSSPYLDANASFHTECSIASILALHFGKSTLLRTQTLYVSPLICAQVFHKANLKL